MPPKDELHQPADLRSDLIVGRKNRQFGSCFGPGLVIDDPDDLVYGLARHPVTTKNYGLTIGSGQVFPELNFTLPPMKLEEGSLEEMYAHYRQVVAQTLQRAAELEAPGVVLECETLPPQTEKPHWAENICRIMLEGMAEAEAKYGLKSALRFTPNDNRGMSRSPRLREGHHWERMLDCFVRVAGLGADMVSIESTGGKDLHDEALIKCDIEGVIFALSVAAVRDMKFLWGHLTEICGLQGVLPAGDSACGFGNTAMVMAEQRLIPRAFAAVVRVLSGIRTLVALECGATGPGKDCAYENPFLKAVTGAPVSGEGKTAACAHLSPLGNISAAYADLWSNESVPNIRLSGSLAPVACLESLVYDCRLFNQAAKEGQALLMRNWLVDSDAGLDSQAYIFRPENVIALAKVMISGRSYYDSAKKTAAATADLLLEAGRTGRIRIGRMEGRYLENIVKTVEAMPDQEDEIIEQILAGPYAAKFDPKNYGL